VIGEKEIDSATFTIRDKSGENQTLNSIEELINFFDQ